MMTILSFLKYLNSRNSEDCNDGQFDNLTKKQVLTQNHTVTFGPTLTNFQDKINPYLQYATAIRLLNDQSVTNKSQAIILLETVAPSNNEAAYNLAHILASGYYLNRTKQIIDQIDPDRAFYWCKMAADNYYPNALTLLASFYSNGFGVEMDQEMAIELYKIAASRGELDALYIMGCIFHYGSGRIAVDKKKAVTYYTESFRGGHLEATFVLADFYQRGDTVEQDNFKAFCLYRAAARKGHVSAQQKLDECY